MARRPIAIARLGPFICQQLIGSKSTHPAKHCGIFIEVPGVTMSKPSKMQKRIANMKTKKVTHSPENLDTKSMGVYLDRNGGVTVFDPDHLPASEERMELLDIAVAIIAAGYEGVKIDETRFSNGKYVHAFAGNMGTPEGVIMQELAAAFSREEPLPSPVQVLVRLEAAYALGGGND